MRRVALLLLLASTGTHLANAFTPVLPTDNDALFRGKLEDFYMFTDRDFEGRKTFPWEGGQYGFVRGPERIGGRVVLTKFHEGIDIRPVRRDASDEPLDDVRSVESGVVVHASTEARDSNYGRYVVIEHEVEGAPVYSIYAHLADIGVKAGQRLGRGERIGRLGYTGAGIDRRRAHLHLEIALLWHDGFESWHASNFPTPNKHGIFNGMNLIGLDVAALYVAKRKDPALTLPAFITGQEPAFRMQFPASPHFQLPDRYPWLVRGDADRARSWTVAFTAAGFPISLEASPAAVDSPSVEWLTSAPKPYSKLSRSLVDGPPGRPVLGEAGRKLLDLLFWDPASAKPPDS